ncbi:MAG: translocation/assembly module TamB, partial [Gammaproteobacteria bacterium]|nr:translocation/assembly module TamB [Gammaproteobacteria bacterium]
LSRLESTPTLRESDILSYLVLGRPPGAASEDESNRLANAAVALALSRSESGIQTIADRSGLSELSLTQELGGLALNVGKQLSPRLFIGYSMGFIEPVNVAKIRYMLSSKWIIESEVSEETRALLKYRFERD